MGKKLNSSLGTSYWNATGFCTSIEVPAPIMKRLTNPAVPGGLAHWTALAPSRSGAASSSPKLQYRAFSRSVPYTTTFVPPSMEPSWGTAPSRRLAATKS